MDSKTLGLRGANLTANGKDTSTFETMFVFVFTFFEFVFFFFFVRRGASEAVGGGGGGGGGRGKCGWLGGGVSWKVVKEWRPGTGDDGVGVGG